MTELSPTAQALRPASLRAARADQLRVRRAPPATDGESCHSADTPSPSLLKHLLSVEGGAAEYQNSAQALPGAVGGRAAGVVRRQPLAVLQHLQGEESWLAAAIPMENPYCSCKLTPCSLTPPSARAGGRLAATRPTARTPTPSAPARMGTGRR